MKCFHHPDVEAIGACALCGHPLCDSCAIEEDRVFYCDPCKSTAFDTPAEEESTTEQPGAGDGPESGAASEGRAQPGPQAFSPPPPGEGKKRTSMAVFLSCFLPFSGQIYNGQFAKALTFLLLFVSCIILAGKTHPLEGLFGAMAAFIYFYQVYDAYKVARGNSSATLSTALVPAETAREYRDADGRVNGEPAAESCCTEIPLESCRPVSKRESPVWGIVLILLGVVFLLDNFNLIRIESLARLWPLFIIGVGLSMILAFLRGGRPTSV